MDRPNILWYCTDQQRADTIRALGNPHIRTPNIDRLVDRGVAFERAYCQSPICTPSRASFLTGRYPAAHHVHRNGNDFFPPGETLVTRLLADAGYDCGLVGKLHLSRAKGRVEKRPDDGYRVFHWSHHPKPDWPEGHAYAEWLRSEHGVDPQALFAEYEDKPYGVPAEYHQTKWCTEMTLRFVDQHRVESKEGPWLMSVNPFDPHAPFDAPREYLERYDPEKLPPPLFHPADIDRQRAFAAIDQQTRIARDPVAMAGSGGIGPGGRAGATRAGVDPAGAAAALAGAAPDTASQPPDAYDARLVKASYYAMIELIDAELGRLIDGLDERGELDNTIIIFGSDHGELLGDHGLLLKGCRFFESLVHVPLVISWPARIRQGLRSRALVELVDLAPTVLEAAGEPVPYEMQGRSLLPILTGEADPHRHKPHVVSEYWDAVVLPEALGPTEHSHATMRFDGRYKSVVYHGHGLGEVYDLENDPGEFENLWNRPEAAELRTRLLLEHLDAFAATGGAGVERTDSY